ncbi:MAG: hypothetical protein JXR64_07135, partial [Spirochaetales bacterium]|nr:hypothetical protein [Spirochaetales bacterium]
ETIKSKSFNIKEVSETANLNMNKTKELTKIVAEHLIEIDEQSDSISSYMKKVEQLTNELEESSNNLNQSINRFKT